MTEEIKEIDIKKDLYLCSPLLNKECTKENCYINNGCCCHTVNEKYSQEHLLNYITNLQKENEYLKLNNPEMNIEHFKIIKENKRKIDILRKQNKDYKSRNEKAIEYIKSHNPSDVGICGNDKKYYYTLSEDSVDNLLNILKGGNEK